MDFCFSVQNSEFQTVSLKKPTTQEERKNPHKQTSAEFAMTVALFSMSNEVISSYNAIVSLAAEIFI